MRRRDFLLGAVAVSMLPRAAIGQSRRRESERQRVEERSQERREERRANEDRADARRDRRRRDEERADERRDELREERLNRIPSPPHTPTRPLDQPIPPPR